MFFLLDMMPPEQLCLTQKDNWFSRSSLWDMVVHFGCNCPVHFGRNHPVHSWCNLLVHFSLQTDTWAIQEQALKRDSTPNKKVGAFLLSFVPIGGIYSFLHASRTIIRKDRLSNLTISSVFAVLLMSVMLFSSKDGINYILTGEEPPEEEAAVAVIPDPSLQPLSSKIQPSRPHQQCEFTREVAEIQTR